MSNTINPVRAWMHAATVAEQKELARRAGTTKGQLHQLGGGHRLASSGMAGRIEAASLEMHRESKGRLPKVFRTDLSEDCRACQYAARCLGQRAVISEFPIVSGGAA